MVTTASIEFRRGLALGALARRKNQAAQLEPFLPRNEDMPAGAPMHYRCVECGMPIFVDEEWVEKQAYCGECMFLIEQGWLTP
jgi:hypothetical protein